MNYSEPIQKLVDDHDLILSVLNAVDLEIKNSGREKAIERQFFSDFIRFSEQFADQLHHTREETILFPAMIERGLSREGGPIACMFHEHDEGRAYVKRMNHFLHSSAANDPIKLEQFREDVRNYSNHLRNHIQKENDILYRMADEMLTDHDKKQVDLKMILIDSTPSASTMRENCISLAKGIVQRAEQLIIGHHVSP